MESALTQTIAQHITVVTGEPFRPTESKPQGGGCINQTIVLRQGQRSFFVKLNSGQYLAMLISEARALTAMAATKTIRVPQVICYGIAGGSRGDTAYLVLEYLPLTNRHTAQDWQTMGQQLAAMHRVSSDQGFGWSENNTIGSTPQPNPWTKSWREFWQNHRIGFQIELAQRQGWRCVVPTKTLSSAIDRLLGDHEPLPAMVHGDLWSGNASFTCGADHRSESDGHDSQSTPEPVIYDPALYFGDREVDLAMTHLFGGFPGAFYQGYMTAYPLPPGYQERQDLYNLYHILNHFNLFGGGYGAQANSIISKLCR
ncbi:MAG: fructosamine kinase family protein [Pseudanabaenaceae cyanobacterium]|jgi:fructosamine-3-kinase